MSIKPHVGIIGAGFSGLRCADILVQNGARVTILEARDRIGGRVGSSPAVHATFAFSLASCHGESYITDHGALLIGFVFSLVRCIRRWLVVIWWICMFIFSFLLAFFLVLLDSLSSNDSKLISILVVLIGFMAQVKIQSSPLRTRRRLLRMTRRVGISQSRVMDISSVRML